MFDAEFPGPLLDEIKVLGQPFGAVDMWWPFDASTGASLLLAIMIDGEGHSTRPHHGRSIARQQSLDRAFDAECTRSGRNVLRLDYRDKADWPDLMHDALAACKESDAQPFAMYSQSYLQDT